MKRIGIYGNVETEHIPEILEEEEATSVLTVIKGDSSKLARTWAAENSAVLYTYKTIQEMVNESHKVFVFAEHNLTPDELEVVERAENPEVIWVTT